MTLCQRSYFNPLPPCGGRQKSAEKNINSTQFQSTPPMRRETFTASLVDGITIFQSTPPMRRETSCSARSRPARNFNPLPPCGGRRQELRRGQQAHIYFNPLPPCGGRQSRCWQRAARSTFQSTPPMRRETSPLILWIVIIIYFNPLPPCGGRRK